MGAIRNQMENNSPGSPHKHWVFWVIEMKSSLRRREWLYGMSLLALRAPTRPPTVTHRNSSLFPRGTPSSLRTQRTTPYTIARSQSTVGEEPVSQSGRCCCLFRCPSGPGHTISQRPIQTPPVSGVGQGWVIRFPLVRPCMVL
jgi:hypothetical protein